MESLATGSSPSRGPSAQDTPSSGRTRAGKAGDTSKRGEHLVGATVKAPFQQGVEFTSVPMSLLAEHSNVARNTYDFGRLLGGTTPLARYAVTSLP
jgi:hypothetical protein